MNSPDEICAKCSHTRDFHEEDGECLFEEFAPAGNQKCLCKKFIEKEE